MAKRALRSLKSEARAISRENSNSKLMFYVYLIRSINHPNRTYIGFTTDLKKRFKAHNAGQSTHTKGSKPWSLETYIAFSGKEKAKAFETYLKSHSGMAFAQKRLW